MNQKRILMIIGSLRKESFQRQLAQLAQEMLGERAEVAFLDYTQVPFFNQDMEFPVPLPGGAGPGGSLPGGWGMALCP